MGVTIDVPQGSRSYADKAYNDYDIMKDELSS